MSKKTKKTLKIGAAEGELETAAETPRKTNPAVAMGAPTGSIFQAFPSNAQQKKTETLTIRLTRDLSDKLDMLHKQTGMSTSKLVYEILDKSIDEVLRVNQIQ